MASSPRARNPHGPGQRLRGALMDAARELLLELGDQDKLSVRAVTARAGVTPNALYIHFAGKDELLSAVMTAGYSELRAFLAAEVPPDEAPTEQLKSFARAYLEFAAQRPGIYRVLLMTRVREGIPVPAPGVASGGDEGVDTFNDLLKIVERCLPDETDPFRPATYFWAGLHGYATLHQVVPAFPWPPEADYIERMIQVHIEAFGQRAPGTS